MLLTLVVIDNARRRIHWEYWFIFHFICDHGHDRNHDIRIICIDLIHVFQMKLWGKGVASSFFTLAVYSHDHLYLKTGSGTFTSSLEQILTFHRDSLATRILCSQNEAVDTALVSKLLSSLPIYHYRDYLINNFHLEFTSATLQLLTLTFFIFPENNLARFEFVRVLSLKKSVSIFLRPYSILQRKILFASIFLDVARNNERHIQ